MGWPIFWSDLEPLKELTWLSWDEDPADGLSESNNIPNPR